MAINPQPLDVAIWKIPSEFGGLWVWSLGVPVYLQFRMLKTSFLLMAFPLSPPSPCTLGEGHERSEPHRWAVQMSAESWTDGKSPWLNIALPCHVVASKNDQSLGGSDQWPSLCLSISIYGGSQFKLMESGKTPIWLVVTGTWISFFHILGISSSQLTNSIIFQRGRLNHQPAIYTVGFFVQVDPCVFESSQVGLLSTAASKESEITWSWAAHFAMENGWGWWFYQ